MEEESKMVKVYRNEDTEITVNESWCKSCGICIYYCPKKVLVPDQKGHPIVENISHCIQCMLCELRCPDFAISIRKVEYPVGYNQNEYLEGEND